MIPKNFNSAPFIMCSRTGKRKAVEMTKIVKAHNGACAVDAGKCLEAFVKRNVKLIRWECFQHQGLEEIVIDWNIQQSKTFSIQRELSLFSNHCGMREKEDEKRGEKNMNGMEGNCINMWNEWIHIDERASERKRDWPKNGRVI